MNVEQSNMKSKVRRLEEDNLKKVTTVPFFIYYCISVSIQNMSYLEWQKYEMLSFAIYKGKRNTKPARSK